MTPSESKVRTKGLWDAKHYGTLSLATYLCEGKTKQEGHEALNRSPEYTGQSQTFNFEI